MPYQRYTRVLLGVIVASSAATTLAGTIRHDRSDSQYLSLASQSQYESVGQFRFNRSGTSGTWLGSGTLVANNWVLTAGHVVDDAASMDFKIGGSTFNATNWFAHKKWDGSLSSGYDIGLVQFEQDISAALGISAAQRYSGSNEVGAIGTAVGFGYTGTGLTGATTYDGNKRAGNNVIDAVYDTRGKDDRILLSDFDNPDKPADSSWGSSAPLDLEYMIAGGDSGGGLFIDSDGMDLLAGIHSFGWGLIDGDPNSDYGDASGHTRVSSFNDWIDGYIAGGTDDGTTDGGGGKGNNGKGGGKPFTASGSMVPEPGSFAILGVVGLGLIHRRRRG